MLTQTASRARARRLLATVAFWSVVALSIALVSEPRSRAPIAGAARTQTGRNPLRGLARPIAPPLHLRGEIRERLVAGSYSYLRVTSEHGPERWLVTVGSSRAVGECVELTAYAIAANFESPRLRRRFDPLLFGSARACP